MLAEAENLTMDGSRQGDSGPAWGGWMAAALGVVAAILAFTALRSLGSVLKPLAFAWVLMLMLAPLVKFASSKLRMPEGLAILLSMAVAIFVFFKIGAFVNSLVSSFVSQYSFYAEKFQSLLKYFYSQLPDTAVAMLREFDWVGGISEHVFSLSGMVISASSTAATVLIITAFLLVERRDLALKLNRAFSDSGRANQIVGSISAQVSRYLLLQCLISAATGLAIWLALWGIGIDFAATWGALAFALNFIPTVGSILASIPPLLTALVQYAPGSYLPFFVALAAILAIQTLIGNVISPRLMGNRLNLSPVVILVSLLFWNWLWGIPGALLATPFTAAMKIICDNIKPFEPIGIFLGSGRQLRAKCRRARRRRHR